MQDFTLTIHGANIRDVEHVVVEALRIGLDISLTWSSIGETDDEAGYIPPSVTGHIVNAVGSPSTTATRDHVVDGLQ